MLLLTYSFWSYIMLETTVSKPHPFSLCNISTPWKCIFISMTRCQRVRPTIEGRRFDHDHSDPCHWVALLQMSMACVVDGVFISSVRNVKSAREGRFLRVGFWWYGNHHHDHFLRGWGDPHARNVIAGWAAREYFWLTQIFSDLFPWPLRMKFSA